MVMPTSAVGARAELERRESADADANAVRTLLTYDDDGQLLHDVKSAEGLGAQTSLAQR